MAAVPLLAVLLVACGASGPTLGDVQRVWCGAHPEAVVTAGTDLGIPAPEAVRWKAELEQAYIDGGDDAVTSLILQRVAQSITGDNGQPTDPHPSMKAMQSWETDSSADWQRACMAAWEAGKSQ